MLVDWLGRGGIAQTTEAWAAELRSRGVAVSVATRPGRELSPAAEGIPPASAAGGRIAAHRRVVRRAVELIELNRPTMVVVQNYVVPPLERPVLAAARRVGARVVLVVHDHRLHTLRAGTRAGLLRAIRAADVVVAHSAFVADAVTARSGRQDIVVLPLPVPVGVLAPMARPPVQSDGALNTAVHFGVLRRGYKGTGTVLALARAGVPDWQFRLVGNGAPEDVPGVEVIAGFVPSARLVEAVATAQATVLPYSFATQSGAVVLAQALGSVVVTTAAGGLPEQVEDGVTGRLLAPGAPLGAWHDALCELSDPAVRRTLAGAARQRVLEQHRRFAAGVATLAGAHRPV